MQLLENNDEAVHDKKINDQKFEDKAQKILKLSYCGTWPLLLNINIVDHLIKIGPIQIIIDKYPNDQNARHFSSSFYNRKLSNGEAFCRRWLVYSGCKDSAFCFCCKVFDNKSNSTLVGDEFNIWKRLSETEILSEVGGS